MKSIQVMSKSTTLLNHCSLTWLALSEMSSREGEKSNENLGKATRNANIWPISQIHLYGPTTLFSIHPNAIPAPVRLCLLAPLALQWEYSSAFVEESVNACSGSLRSPQVRQLAYGIVPYVAILKKNNAEHYTRKREEGGQIFRGGDTRKKGTDRRCRACLELVYESWAINRIVYSIVAATGF